MTHCIRTSNQPISSPTRYADRFRHCCYRYHRPLSPNNSSIVFCALSVCNASMKSPSASPSRTEDRFIIVMPILWSVTRSCGTHLVDGRKERSRTNCLRIVVRPDFLASVCTLDDRTSRCSSVQHICSQLAIKQTSFQNLECAGSILNCGTDLLRPLRDVKAGRTKDLVLAPLVLHGHCDTRRDVGEPHCGFCFIDVLVVK